MTPIMVTLLSLSEQPIQVNIRDPWGPDALEQTTTVTCGASTSTIRFRNHQGRGEVTLVQIEGRRMRRAEAEITGWINAQAIESIQSEGCAPSGEDAHPASRWLIVTGASPQQRVSFFLNRFWVRRRS